MDYLIDRLQNQLLEFLAQDQSLNVRNFQDAKLVTNDNGLEIRDKITGDTVLVILVKSWAGVPDQSHPIEDKPE